MGLQQGTRRSKRRRTTAVCSRLEVDNTRYCRVSRLLRRGSRRNKKRDSKMAEREEFLKTVKRYPYALQSASAELKGDRKIVMAAVKQRGTALYQASAELKGDQEIVMVAVKQNGFALECASAELQGDREIVMEAVKKNGRALQYASAELKGDREIVMEAVAQDPKALQYASDELTNGGFEDHVNDMMNNRFNVSPETFIATILFGAKGSPAVPIDDGGLSSSSHARLGNDRSCFLPLLQPSTMLPMPLSIQIKRLIWEFAGVRSGPQWKVIEAAEVNFRLH